MRHVFQFLCIFGMLHVLNGCGVSDVGTQVSETPILPVPSATSKEGSIYPSPADCARDPDRPGSVTFNTYVTPPSIAEASQQASLIVEGTIIAVGAFGQPYEQVVSGTKYGTLFRYYTFQVDTYHKGQAPDTLEVILVFNDFYTGNCLVDQAMLERNFRPGEDPQFQVGERYILFLQEFSKYCNSPCYALSSLNSRFRISADGSLEMLIPADARQVVQQNLQLDDRPLRQQVDDALQQLATPPSK